MKVVCLASGGLDSSVVSVLAAGEGNEVHPLFVDYGQRSADREWQACIAVHERYGLPAPTRVDVPGYGRLVRSGLTSGDLDVVADAFTPGRNLLLIVLGAAFAFQVGASRLSLGLLTADRALFPDQSDDFLRRAEGAVEAALGTRIQLLVPLRDFAKADVVRLAADLGIVGTYSCHMGGALPCGSCIACKEYT